MHVTIKRVDDWHGPLRSELEVFVDGAPLGGGSYGGEPEDNSALRDYAWVETLLEGLAKRLGATVERQVSDASENGA